MKVIALLFLASCAVAAPQGNGRIVGGYTASRGQFPHQVSMRMGDQHFCGGSIVTPTKILTAAHCIYGSNINGMNVVVGETKLNAGGQRHYVIQGVIHQSYDPQRMVNDVAMLTLASSIQFNSLVRQVTLRSNNVNQGEVLTLSGWGQLSEPGYPPNDLQYMSMRAITVQSCAQQLVGLNPITTGHVCTSSPAGQGACMGDSGGPLIDASGYQIGVVSWGVPCARGAPDVFTNVPTYLGWIQAQAQ